MDAPLTTSSGPGASTLEPALRAPLGGLAPSLPPLPAAPAPRTAATVGIDLRRLRLSRHESQEKFWSRFGVTQSSGSRFESGLALPAPVAILLQLYVSGKLSDEDLPG
jgi:hypothetical protein